MDYSMNYSKGKRVQTNDDVVYNFMRRLPAYTRHLESRWDKLFSYNTCIAEFYDGVLLVNKEKYSQTTSRHTNLIYYNSKVADYKIVEVEGKYNCTNLSKFYNKMKDKTLVKFYSKTCGPCKVLDKTLKDAGIDFIDYEVSSLEELKVGDQTYAYPIEELGVHKIPTLMVFDGIGNPCKGKLHGVKSAKEVQEFIDNAKPKKEY